MLNLLSIVLIVFIVFFLIIFKKKNIINIFHQKNLCSLQKLHKEQKQVTYRSKNNDLSYRHKTFHYTEFDKRKLKKKMLKLFQGTSEEKLKALKIAKELADKSTLTILRRGLRDIDPEIVEISANLINKFK